MTVEEKDDFISFNNNSQKTVYMLPRKPGHPQVRQSQDKLPMVPLLQGKEDPLYMEVRMVMFQRFWSMKENKINGILQNRNNDLLQDIANYLQQDNINTTFRSVLLLMGSSLANHSLVLNNMFGYFKKLDLFKIINLSSKDCVNVKTSLISLIRQVLASETNNGDDDLDSNAEIRGYKNDENESEEEDDDDEEYVGDFLKYDFDAVVDWFDKQSKEGVDIPQILVIFEDSESFESSCLSSMINIIRSSKVQQHFKFIFALSSSVSLFEENLPSTVIEAIDGQIFSLNNPKETIREITDQIMFDLELENSSDFLLLLGPSLLNELTKFEHNELLFIDVLKYSYSIYFYNNPLSILNLVTIEEDEEDEFEIDNKLIDCLRRTKSFKNRIEKLAVFNKNEEILILFEDDEILAKDFKKHYRDYYKLGGLFYKMLDLFISLQICFNNGKVIKSKFEIYSMIIQQDSIFTECQFYLELLNLLQRNSEVDNLDNFLKDINDQTFITQDDLNDHLGEKLVEEITPQSLKLICKKLGFLIDQQIKKFFIQFNEIFYKEIFTIDIIPPNLANDENIIESSFNPFIRSSIESALNNPNSYLFMSQESHSAYDELAQLIEPILCELFTLYRELNILVNVHDFFIAFKESLERTKLCRAMVSILKDVDNDPELLNLCQELEKLTNEDEPFTTEQEVLWEKITLSWFLQLVNELEFIGFIKEAKKRSDAVEKLVWKGI